jgi:hypothetical protein
VQKVFISYQLAPGVTMEEYTEWSRSVDQRITPLQDSIVGFTPWRIAGGEPANPATQIMEEIAVDSFEAFKAMQDESEEMKEVIEGFERLVDQSTVVLYYADRVK